MKFLEPIFSAIAELAGFLVIEPAAAVGAAVVAAGAAVDLLGVSSLGAAAGGYDERYGGQGYRQ